MKLAFSLAVLLIGAELASAASIDDARIAVIAKRGQEPKDSEIRGATPQLTVAKHQLRDWIDARLKSVSRSAEVATIEHELNNDLTTAGLICDYNDAAKPICPEWFQMGFAAPVHLKRDGAFLVLTTGVGIECGYDHSAYIYAWSDDGWRRVWQNEQNTYTEKEYRPQALDAILISPYSRTNDYVVLTVGHQTWCASNWHDVYWSVYRLGPDPDAAPLIAGSRWAYLAHDPPIQGAVTNTDVLVEFTPGSIDGGVHSRPAILHYKLNPGNALAPVKRINPLALRPRDFVDEWLISDWRAGSDWSEDSGRAAARDWHKALHKEEGLVFAEFFPTMHCNTPDLWQVGVDFKPDEDTARKKPIYFLVRWRPPYKFSMVQVNDRPTPGCTQRDRDADETPRTMFPNWH